MCQELFYLLSVHELVYCLQVFFAIILLLTQLVNEETEAQRSYLLVSGKARI
jgi:hypothetical protein